MRLLSQLERRFGSLAIQNLTLYLAFGQMCGLLLIVAKPDIAERMVLIPDNVFAGEWWRVITFAFLPLFGGTNPLFAVFGLLFFYFIGNTLENHWGEFQFNLFLLIGYLATLAASLVETDMPTTNGFIAGSMFLAFAILFPDYVIYIMFIFPVKVKWIAMVSLTLDIVALTIGSWGTRAVVAASLLNVCLFFHRELIDSIKGAKSTVRQKSRRAEFKSDGVAAFHTCAVCGITDQSHPKMEFRYCPSCVGGLGYCTHHINNHAHRAAVGHAPTIPT